MKAVTKALSILGAVAVLIGCGGGGGDSATGGLPAGSARVGVFVTDDLTTDYDHVWVTIQKVELQRQGNAGSVTVFDDPTGRTVDLRALNDAGTQKFALLGEAVIPAGNYSSAEITVTEAVSLVPAGSTTAIDRIFAGSTNGVKQLEFNLTQGNVNGATDIVADFDLSQWTVDGQFVNAVVVQGSDDNVNGNQEAFEFAGIVSGLNGTAPNFSFDLVQGPWSLRVVTSAATTIYNNNGAPNPTLANGTRVQVRGTFDTTTRTLTATDVKIKLTNDVAGQVEVEGAVSNVTDSGFDLSTAKVEGFIPSSTSVKVAVGATTRYFTDRGISISKDEFFAALATAGFAEAEGSYDEGSNTLTAVKVKIEDEDEGGDEQESEVTGPAGSVDSSAFTFQITVQQWEGVSVAPGTVLTVVTNANTEYPKTTKEAFWTAIANGALVEVKGSLDGTTLTAERVKFEDEGGDDNGGGGDDDDDDDDDDSGHGGGDGN